MRMHVCTAHEKEHLTLGILSDVVLEVFLTEKRDDLCERAQRVRTSFQTGNALKGLSWGQNWSIYYFFTPGGQIIQLRKKVHIIKKSFHVERKLLYFIHFFLRLHNLALRDQKQFPVTYQSLIVWLEAP